jgi:adenine-specific DNA-methyltransferase
MRIGGHLPTGADVGTQAQFKKKKPPVTYRYDSSLSSVLDWDGQNPAREQGEAVIRPIIEATLLEDAERAPRNWVTNLQRNLAAVRNR